MCCPLDAFYLLWELKFVDKTMSFLKIYCGKIGKWLEGNLKKFFESNFFK